MALQLYDTVELMGVIQTLKPVNTFWRDTCFGTVQTFNTEYIDFDMVNGGRRLAPFVAPTVRRQGDEGQGLHHQAVRPAYIKPKMTFDPNRVLKRRPGEPYTGMMSPAARRDAIVADMIRDGECTSAGRWMAAQAVLTSRSPSRATTTRRR